MKSKFQKWEQALVNALTRMDSSSRVKVSAYSLLKNGDHLLVTRRVPDEIGNEKKKVA